MSGNFHSACCVRESHKKQANPSYIIPLYSSTLLKAQRNVVILKVGTNYLPVTHKLNCKTDRDGKKERKNSVQVLTGVGGKFVKLNKRGGWNKLVLACLVSGIYLKNMDLSLSPINL